MSQVFGATYAGLYDAIYRDKDYAGECRLVERLLEAYGEPPMQRLLDLGCGTGRHAELLARSGHEVVGVDRSEPMLEQARIRGRDLPTLRFVSGDARDTEAGAPASFDAVLMMFAVLSYHTESSDVRAAIHNVHRHLRNGGLFLFDVWFGPAVLTQRPETRTRVIDDEDGRRYRRTVAADIDLLRQRCDVTIDTALLQGSEVVSTSREIHPMRFFFPHELEILLGEAGLRLLHLGRFPEVETPPDVTSWNVMGIARAV
jgi:SAM-dependent methyltransferase